MKAFFTSYIAGTTKCPSYSAQKQMRGSIRTLTVPSNRKSLIWHLRKALVIVGEKEEEEVEEEEEEEDWGVLVVLF